jgi:hypothetical protein
MAPWLSLALLACTGPAGDPADTDGPTGVDTDAAHTGDTATSTRVRDAFEYAPPVVDVLMVVDASCSMVGPREVLRQSIDGFVGDLEALGYDYHVGVTSIDQTNTSGALEEFNGLKWAESDQPAPADVLSQLVGGVDGNSAVEAGRAVTWRALTLADDPGELNHPFLRDDSQVAVIVHTDADDQSGNVPINAADFVDFLQTFRPTGDLFFHSIATTDDYFGVTDTVGGVRWRVENTPYGPPMQAMTDMFHEARLHLSEPPDLQTLEVRVLEPSGVARLLAPAAYEVVDDTVLIVAEGPVEGDTVEISYEPLAAAE